MQTQRYLHGLHMWKSARGCRPSLAQSCGDTFLGASPFAISLAPMNDVSPPEESLFTVPCRSGIFEFETDFAGSLRCIPMCVRLKLDQSGIKLSLKQWNRIPPPERRQLVDRPCNDPIETQAYQRYLVALIETHTKTAVEFAPVDESPPWVDSARVPERIRSYASGLGLVPPSVEQWTALTPLQRFALFKLTRPGHSNDNFLPAMREFSLLV
jgi:hypothetical protein